MEKLSKVLAFVIFIFSVEFEQAFSQCNPPPAETCEEASLFCSFDEMNGFSCYTPSMTVGNCRSGCGVAGGIGYRTWWAFVSQGGNFTLTLNVGTCSIISPPWAGIVLGVWSDCDCGQEIMCIPYLVQENETKTYQLSNLKPCKTYYISMDHDEDYCDFTINTSGGSPPTLSPLGFINNVPNGIIQPVCVGFCDYKFFVNPQPGGCEPTYVWTLDGNEVGDNNNEIQLDFPDEGDFVICVTAYIGNPLSGSICSQAGPKCATVQVRPVPDKTGVPRTLCWEQVNPAGYRWHSQSIFTSGVYRQQIKDNNCCMFDSVVEFTVLPDPVPPDVYFITCNNKPFIDLLGRSYLPCKDHFEISLPKTTDRFKCDSSIKLTAVNVDFAPLWKVQCVGGQVEISPDIIILNQCNVGESYKFDYRWYEKNDTANKTISTDERLVVNGMSAEYCVEVNVRVDLGTNFLVCSKTFCESFNEGGFTPVCFPLAGDSILCNGTNGTYRIDTFINLPVLSYSWTITGGSIVSKPDSSVIEVKWNLAKGDTGTVCTFYNTDCGKSCQKCLRVLIGSSSNPYAGPDDSICDLSYKFNGIKDQGGYWKQISGPGLSTITDTTDPQSNVVVDQYGMYRFVYIETIGACNNTDTVDLYFNSKTDSSSIFYYCDSAIINGQKYTQSARFTQQLKSVIGCDSIINTEIIIQTSSQTDISQTGCDSITIDNTVYTSSGTYKQMMQTSTGCDSILNLDLTIWSSSQTDYSQTECDSIVINNISYTQSGTYQQKLQTTTGCDSIINLDLTIQSSSQTEFNQTACDSVVFNGKTYKQSGNYTERYIASNGCDSVIVLHVNIPNSNTAPLMLTRCDSVTINNVHYTQSGKYTQQLTSANGCDSILNIELEIQSSSQAVISQTGCDSVVVNNIRYVQSGPYQQKLQTHAGCDSTLNINLNIVKSSSGDTLFRSCDSVIINGQTYTQTGIYQQTLTNTNQCDSILIIDFTRLSKTSTVLSLRSCDSLVINNQVYKQSGNYTQTFVNANQCDSILNLEIEIQSSSQADYSQTGCDSVSINGQIYYQSGSYKQLLTNADQCDSTLNINLTIHKSISIDYPFKSCDSATINGQIYKQSGNYQQILSTANGCDSILNLDIEIRKSGKAEIGKEGCDSLIVNNISYNQSGIYKQILQSTNGCDSTLTLDLSIKPGNPSTLEAGKDTSICEGEILKLNGIFNGPARFNWQSAIGNFDNPDQLASSFYSNTTGNGRIYLQAVDDCKQWLDSLAIQILPNQFVQVTGDTIIDPCKEKEIRFTASGGTNYTWTPSSNIECLDPPCSHVLLKSNLASRFTITTDGPCAFPANLNLSLSQTQSDVYLPNAFSPNGDNINDIFQPIFNCDQITFYNLQIFDRWGNLMFESTNKELGWNGKQEEVQMIPGVYPYVVEYELHGVGRKVKAGEVTLLK